MSILILLAHCLLPGTTHPLHRYKAIWFGTKQASCYTATQFLFCLPHSYFLFSSLPAPSVSVAQPGPPEKQLLNQQRGRPNSCSRSPLGLNRPHMKVGKSSSGVCQGKISVPVLLLFLVTGIPRAFRYTYIHAAAICYIINLALMCWYYYSVEGQLPVYVYAVL